MRIELVNLFQFKKSRFYVRKKRVSKNKMVFDSFVPNQNR